MTRRGSVRAGCRRDRYAPALLVALAALGVACGPSPTPTARDGLDDATLQRAISTLAARAAPGRLGVGVMDLDTGKTWYWNGAERFPMQSVFKAPLGAAVLAAVDEGRLALDEVVTVGAADLSPPLSRISADWPGRTSYTVGDLLALAAGGSDNTAADLLAVRVGGPAAVTEWLRSKGVEGLSINRLEREFQTAVSGMGAFRPEWRTSEAYAAALLAVPEIERRRAMQAWLADPRDTTTPAGAVAFLARLQRGELLSPSSTSHLLRILTETRTDQQRLKAGLPEGTRLAHKTGTGRPDLGIAPAVNDIGIATLASGRQLVIVALLSGATSTEAEHDAILADVARAAVAALR